MMDSKNIYSTANQENQDENIKQTIDEKAIDQNVKTDTPNMLYQNNEIIHDFSPTVSSQDHHQHSPPLTIDTIYSEQNKFKSNLSHQIICSSHNMTLSNGNTNCQLHQPDDDHITTTKNQSDLSQIQTQNEIQVINSQDENPIQVEKNTENTQQSNQDEQKTERSPQSSNTYIVQKGETIQSIAIKFDTTVQWIKSANQLFDDLLFEGDSLKVKPDADELPPPEPIPCTHFDTNDSFAPQQGRLVILDDTLLFEPDDKNIRPILLDLNNYVESVAMVHPSNNQHYTDPKALYIFMLAYLNPANNDRFSMIYFSAIKQDIDKITENVNIAVKNITKKPKPIHQMQRYNSALIPEPKEIPTETSKLESNDSLAHIGDKTYSMPILSPIITNEKSSILTSSNIENLRYELPYRYKNSKWNLLFRLSRDGTSYTTFYHKTEKKKPIIIAIKTSTRETIGSFITCELHNSNRYYGTGETFAFHFQPKLEVFKWNSSSNHLFIHSTESEFSIGGDSPAIWIDDRFLSAYSESCSTFKSPPLTKSTNFKIIDIEVWQLVVT